MKRTVNCIAAMDCKRGIGRNNNLPWKLKKEFRYFTDTTTKVECSEKQNAVIMGKNTYESIPKKFRPLKNRFNIVLSHSLQQTDVEDGLVVLPNFAKAMDFLNAHPYNDLIENIWIIGGSGVYKEAMDSHFCEKVYITKVQGDFSCDVFYPEFETNYKEIYPDSVPKDQQEENGVKYSFHVYTRHINIQ